jgi:hypothetical protein
MSDPRDEDRQRRLQALLDDTLRAMVQGEGPPDLRRRVLARVDRPPRRLWWPAWAIAAVVTVLVAVVWLRPLRERGFSAPPTASSTPATTSSAPRASATPVPSPPIFAAPDRSRIRKPLPTEPADPSVPALTPPEPIAIAALGPPDIEIEPLSLDPLVVPHLAVEPLGEPEHERKD